MSSDLILDNFDFIKLIPIKSEFEAMWFMYKFNPSVQKLNVSYIRIVLNHKTL